MKKSFILFFAFGLIFFALFFRTAASSLGEECSDSDGGFNYREKGIVSYLGASYEDYCIDERKLKEFACGIKNCRTTFVCTNYSNSENGSSCGTNVVCETYNKSVDYNCEGVCREGACRSEVSDDSEDENETDDDLDDHSENINSTDDSEDENETDFDEDFGGSLGEEDLDSNVISNRSDDNSSVIERKCDGCLIGENCVQVGYRSGGKYCDLGGFKEFGSAGTKCDNNFECSSNVCVSGQCVSPGLIERIISWFKKFFGD